MFRPYHCRPLPPASRGKTVVWQCHRCSKRTAVWEGSTRPEGWGGTPERAFCPKHAPRKGTR